MKHNFCIKTLKDGRAMLNLGCGTKMNWDWTNVDFSIYAYLARHKAVIKYLRLTGFMSEERYKRLLCVDPKIIRWDLRKGIPFLDESFDVVYCSHFLEHIEKDSVSFFLKECYRVLKHRGIIRIVVPDLETLVNRYVLSASRMKNGEALALDNHQQAIHDLFDQMVRRKPAGRMKQNLVIQIIESFLLGSTEKTGELHRWMYDRYSLKPLLSGVGFKDIRAESPFTSRIEGWNQFNLDTNEDGSVYKPGSLYIEGAK
jgi:SAM-dependent methyltransferase